MLQGIALCRRTPALLEALRELYLWADQQIAALGPTCMGGGGCCRFDLAGHRLYASTAEMAILLEVPPTSQTQIFFRCRYQIGPRCTARARRPLGCRTYFCDEEIELRGRLIYETCHEKIRQLHDLHKVPYIYSECTCAVSRMYT